MLKKLTAIFLCSSCLMSCQTAGFNVPLLATTPVTPHVVPQEVPVIYASPVKPISGNYKGLGAWWSFFGDPVLDGLVSSGISMNATNLGEKVKFPSGNVIALELRKYYKDPRVEFVNNITKDYVEYRYIQNQRNLLVDYIAEQELKLGKLNGRDLDQVKQELGLLRAKNKKFKKQLVKLTVKMSDATKLLPEYVEEVLKQHNPVPVYNITLILASSSLVLASSSDIDVARTMLSHETLGQIGEADTKNLIPDITLNKLFGIPDDVFVNINSRWRVAIGEAKNNVQFDMLDRNAGNSGAKRKFKKAVFDYITEVEQLLVTTATLRDQQRVLEKAISSAEKANIYKTRLASLRAEYETAKTVIALFNKLDLY